MLLGTACFAQGKPVTTIPFVLEKNVIYVYCRVNETDSLKFIFDTGADGSVINKDTKRLPRLTVNGKSVNQGSNGTNEVEVSSGNHVMLGSLTHPATLTLIPFGTDEFDGVIGTDLMKNYTVEINYSKNEIRYYTPNDPAIDVKEFTKWKLHFIDNYPAVESTIKTANKEYKGLFGLDTGADDLLTLAAPFAKRNKLDNAFKNIGSATFMGSNGVGYEMPVLLCPEIVFTNKSLYNIPIYISKATEGIDATDKMAGFFGNNFLKRFTAIIDFKNSLIYFKLSRHLYSDPY